MSPKVHNARRADLQEWTRKGREEVLGNIKETAHEDGTPIILVSHSMEGGGSVRQQAHCG